MKLLPRILADEDELDRQPGIHAQPRTPQPAEDGGSGPGLAWILLVTAGALVPRLAYLFGFSDPQNAGDGFTDAYHHWQIAYLTKDVGLSHGRLWDMRGWEYFWGLLHPALMNVLFFLTGSTNIVLDRLLGLGFGSCAVVLIFLLCHRYWGMPVAVTASAFAAFLPPSVFNDDAGMAEPIAMALILFGIWLTPKRGFWAGASWGIAAMARIEAWFFGAGLVVAWLLRRRSVEPRWFVILGWALVMGVYAKFLLDQTGNPIYPLFWNFQFVALGANGTGTALTSDQRALVIPLGIAVLAAVAGLAWSLWKQPRSYLLLTYGFGYSALSLATYLRYFTEWKERRFELPLDFAAILVALLLFKVVPLHSGALRTGATAVSVLGLAASQLFWIPIQAAYTSTEPLFQYEVALGDAIGAVYNRPENRGGVLNMPGDEPTLLYVLARDAGVRGDHVTSQFYDPFYYLPAGYTYTGHKEVAGPLLQCWLWKTHTRLMLLSPPGPLSQSVPDYEAFIADNPVWFVDSGAHLSNGWLMVVVQVPAPTSGECEQAALAAPH